MKYLLIITLVFGLKLNGFSQTVTGLNGYQVVDLGDNGQGDFLRSLILLHEIYNGALLPFNNAVGTITAYRGNQGSFNRIGVAYVSTSSAYNGYSGSVKSLSNDEPWRLKTCMFEGKKYFAVEIPYSDAFHGGGYKFAGWSNSSGVSLKVVNYMFKGQPINLDVISNVQDYKSDIVEQYDVRQMNVFGSMNIGTETANADYLLQVKGKIRSEEIKVETANWPDYVFAKDYKLPSLKQTEQHIKEQRRLPGIPSAAEVHLKGIDLGDMNAKLLKKIEELTLYLIQKDKQLEDFEDKNKLALKQQSDLNSAIQLELKQIKKQLSKITNN